MKLASLLVWLLVSTTLLTLGHVYLQRRLIRDSELPARWQRGLSVALFALLATQPVAFAFARALPRDAFTPWAFVVFLWMGLFSTWFCLLVAYDVARLATRLFQRFAHSNRPPSDPSRRLGLQRLAAGTIAGLGVGLVGYGVREALARFVVKRVEIVLAKLPREFDGFSIVQLSDIHIGPTIGHDFIERMVAAANSLRPDLIAITGDLVDGSVEQLGPHASPLRQLVAPHGAWFVTGNHEYYSGADEWIEELARLGIPTLRNRRVSIERDGAAFDLAGVTDYRAAQYDDAPDLEGALRGRDTTRELVLLAHQPAAVKDAMNFDVGLQLSGHTHGGQFWPWNWVVQLIQPISRGLGRFGAAQIWVNTGTGYWGPPVRTGSEPEITLVTLRAARQA